MAIPLINLQREHDELYDAVHEAIETVIGHGRLVLGPEVEAFESQFAAYCQVKHCVGVGSGTDALALAMKGLGIGRGDEVITAASTSAATGLAIQQTGATPVLVDHDPATYTLDPRRLPAAITARTKAIIPVHLFGHPADMNAIRIIADEHGLLVIEDACQAHGARDHGRRCGSFGHAAAFSFRPGANLSGLGDGGAVVTDDAALAQWIRAARNYGSTAAQRHTVRGTNSRLDTVHAAVLGVKLPYLDEWNEMRRWLAARFGELLGETGLVLPDERGDVEHVYSHFVVRTTNRDELMAFLCRHGIEATVHCATPVHRQVAFGRGCVASGPLCHTETCSEQILSLPMGPFMSLDEVEEVAETISRWHVERPALELVHAENG